ADNEAHLLRSFAAQRVRGVLLTPTDSSLTTAHEIVRQGIPVVLFDSPATPPNMSSVSVNDQKGAELAIEHLLSLGHHRILFLNGPSHVRQAQDRHLGVNRAIKLASQNLQHTISPIELTEISLASFTANAARSELQELIVGSKLQVGRPTQLAPTAIFCANDLIAIGAMTALQASGIRIPEDVSLVGFDDISLAQQTSVSLTTVRQPMKELGWAAADLLLNSQNPSAPKNIEHKSFTPEVIVRDSTAEVSDSQ
ncbi:substrate-binding domain-containing protein, partial [Ancrocorticia populi]|uniref:substrate-binding domain-containing protein n=1 Tax=Ancrocorticia populi TaxID=2175228 RepID=UPI003F8DA27D